MSEHNPDDSWPKAPLHPKTTDDLVELLAWIETCTDSMYTTERAEVEAALIIDQRSYVEFYTAVHNYCTIAKVVNTSNNARRGKSSEFQMRGRNLYHSLERIIRNHCRAVCTQLSQSRDNSHGDGSPVLIKVYLEQWVHYLALATLGSNLFRFFERHWIARELDEKKSDIFTIGKLHMLIWKEEVLGLDRLSTTLRPCITDGIQGLRDLSLALIKLQERLRSGSHGRDDGTIMRDIVGSFDKLGLVLADDSTTTPDNQDSDGSSDTM